MKVKRFVASSIKAALAQVKERLGVDAVILSNRATAEGVEVLAIAEADMAHIAAAPEAGALAKAEPPPGFTASFKRNPAARGSASVELNAVFEPAVAAPTIGEAARPTMASALAKTNPRIGAPNHAILAREPVKPALEIIAPAPDFTHGSDGADVDLPGSLSEPRHFVSRNATVRAFSFADLLKKPTAPVALAVAPRSEAPIAAARPPDSVAMRSVERAAENSAATAVVRGVTATAVAAPDVVSEVRALRGFVEERLAAMSWTDDMRRRPAAATLMRELLAAGFSTSLARAATVALPDAIDAKEGRNWLHARLAEKLAVASAGNDIVERGGVYALTGPTGVGKTTTTAKIAARCVVKYGAASLGLITTDTYRIGAHDQLKVFGKILGVPVHAVQDAASLATTLDTMKGKRLVLIDSIGLGQRDERVEELLAMLDACEVQRLVLLAGTAQIETLEEVLAAYGSSQSSRPAAGAIVTKLDEAVKLGAVVDILVRHKLAVQFVGVGQRVPEDLALPDKNEIVRAALRVTRGGPFALSKDEAGMLAAFTAKSNFFAIGEAHA